jgi:hypothetical protein
VSIALFLRLDNSSLSFSSSSFLISETTSDKFLYSLLVLESFKKKMELKHPGEDPVYNHEELLRMTNLQIDGQY